MSIKNGKDDDVVDGGCDMFWTYGLCSLLLYPSYTNIFHTVKWATYKDWTSKPKSGCFHLLIIAQTTRPILIYLSKLIMNDVLHRGTVLFLHRKYYVSQSKPRSTVTRKCDFSTFHPEICNEFHMLSKHEVIFPTREGCVISNFRP